MANQDNKDKESTMTAAQAAKKVFRLVPVLDDKQRPKLDKDKNIITRKQAIKEEEVMSFADYDDRIVVVTTAGEKLVHTK